MATKLKHLTKTEISFLLVAYDYYRNAYFTRTEIAKDFSTERKSEKTFSATCLLVAKMINKKVLKKITKENFEKNDDYEKNPGNLIAFTDKGLEIISLIEGYTLDRINKSFTLSDRSLLILESLIKSRTEDITVGDLCSRFELATPGKSHDVIFQYVKLLEDKELIKRNHGSNKFNYCIEITDTGRDLVRIIKRIHEILSQE